jgi:hypothetical protein
VRLVPLEPNLYSCTVGRPNPPSYLLMSEFLLSLEPIGSAASVKIQSAELHVRAHLTHAWSSFQPLTAFLLHQGGGKLVPSSQYVVDSELSQGTLIR